MADTQPGGFGSMCVDTATIAAFVDGTLDTPSRARVLAHLASCPDCSELVAEVVRTNEDLAVPTPVPVPVPAPGPLPDDRRPGGKILPMRWKGPAAIGGLLAIAASLVLVVLNRGTAVDPLVAIVGDQRVTLARPTGGFHFGTLRSPMRGGTETENLQLAAEVARLREQAVRSDATAADLHAYGLGQLIAGDASGAIDSLQAAVRAKPGEAAYVADLGAAYMSRFVDRGEASDAAAALAQLEKATALDPSLKEAWFNKALLLERMTRPADALAAWQTYLGLPDVQSWRDEAVRNRDALQRRER